MKKMELKSLSLLEMMTLKNLLLKQKIYLNILKFDPSLKVLQSSTTRIRIYYSLERLGSGERLVPIGGIGTIGRQL